MSRYLAKPPRSYREQDGCHDCVHVFAQHEYDDGPLYYCTFGAPPRPRCGAVAMGDVERWPDSITHPVLCNRAWDVWEEWANHRRVEPHGRCDRHKARMPGKGA